MLSCGRKRAHIPLPPSPLPESWRAGLAALLSLPMPRERSGCVREQPLLAGRSGERDQGPPGTLVMSPAPLVPAECSSSCGKPGCPRLGAHLKGACAFPLPAPLAEVDRFQAWHSGKSLEPALRGMSVRSGLILCALEGSVHA